MRCTIITFVVLTVSLLAHAQSPTFEVASVKPNTSGSGSMSAGWTAGGYMVVNSPLLLVIQTAYGFRDSRLVGVPKWVESERFDITAKVSGTFGVEQRMPMLQALLADRFKLVAHTEAREMPIYALVLARSDGRLGPGLRTSAVDCATSGAPGTGSIGNVTAARSERPRCGSITGAASVVAGGITIARLAAALTPRLDRVVVDRTGLLGLFDVDLTWAMPRVAPGGDVVRIPPAGNVDVGDLRAPGLESGPSLFTAVQEQLGLRLDAQRGPVEVLVIDSIERPTPD